jgi:hypothetical protein
MKLLTRALPFAAWLATFVLPTPAAAQGWSADLSAGRLVYDEGSASIGSDNLLATLRYERRESWVFGSGAAPIGGDDTLWAAGGAGGRFRLPIEAASRLSIGVDVDAHAFSFRDRILDQRGSGGTLEALPFLRLRLGSGFAEAYGGWRGHTLAEDAVCTNRAVNEGGLRAGIGGPVSVAAEARWVDAPDGVFPYVGATVRLERRRVQMWSRAGRWLDPVLNDAEWAAGADLRLTGRSWVWTSFRQDAPDPLYRNSPRRTWSVGVTRRLGGVSAPALAIQSHSAGEVLLRVPANGAPGDELSVGGDFNGWQPIPMRRDGNDWIVKLPLAPGVYHYAFRNALGEWFVPPAVPGRRDDGMGGQVALLLVG